MTGLKGLFCLDALLGGSWVLFASKKLSWKIILMRLLKGYGMFRMWVGMLFWQGELRVVSS